MRHTTKRINSQVMFSIIQILWLVLLFIIYKYSNNVDATSMLKPFCLFCVISALIGLFGMYYQSDRKISFILLFLLLLYVFHLGHYFLGFFGIEIAYYPQYDMTRFNDIDIYNAAWFSLFSLNIIQLAFFMVIQPKSNRNSASDDSPLQSDEYYAQKLAMFQQISLILFFITILPSTYYDLVRIIRASEYAYEESFMYGGNAIIRICKVFFSYSTFALIYCYRNTAKWKTVFYLMFIWQIVLIFFIGNRSTPIMFIFALFLMLSKIGIKPLRITWKMVLAGVVLIFFLNFISVYRAERHSMDAVTILIKSLTTSNPIVNLLSSIGATQITTRLTFEYTPTLIPFANGMTYINSILILVPMSTFLFGADSTKYISLGSELNNYWENKSLGGSMIAETYYNFQWYGLIAVFILALIIACYSNFHQRKYIKKPFLYIASSYFVADLLKYPRGYFYNIVSSLNVLIYLAIIYWIAGQILYRNNYKSTPKHNTELLDKDNK